MKSDSRPIFSLSTSSLILTIICGLTLSAAAQRSRPSQTIADLPVQAQLNIIPQLAKLTTTNTDGNPADYFGMSVATSGNVVVVGAPYSTVNGNVDQGAAYVFVKPSSGWADMTETATLSPSDGVANGNFGLAVAISGNTVVVESGYGGGPFAYVFVEPSGGWANMTQTAKLTSTPNFFGGGNAPSIGTDGNTVVIGVPWAPLRGQFTGAAYVFSKPATGWADMSAPTATLTPESAIGFFGVSVAVNGNNIVSVGPASNIAYLFVKPKKGWQGIRTETAQLSTSTGDLLHSVAINANTIVAGSSSATVGGNVAQGAVYVFVEPSTGWADASETAKLTASDGAADDDLGDSVSINGSGTEIVAGAPGHSSSAGAVYGFLEPSTGWTNDTQQIEMIASDGVAGDFLGSSVGLSGGQVVAGAPAFPLEVPGAAYVYGSSK